MNGRTHFLGGLATCAAVDTFVTSFEPSPLFFAAGMVGAFLPDICHIHSTIGRKLPILSRLISCLVGHRTFTHSVLFLVLIYAGFHLLLPDAQNLIYGLLAGMISHIVLDMGTVRGVRLFFPFPLRVRLPIFIRTGGPFERIIQLILIGSLIIWSYQFMHTWL